MSQLLEPGAQRQQLREVPTETVKYTTDNLFDVLQPLFGNLSVLLIIGVCECCL